MPLRLLLLLAVLLPVVVPVRSELRLKTDDPRYILAGTTIADVLPCEGLGCSHSF